MKKIFYLKTCSTCTRILKELQPGENWTLREIKSEPVTVEELEKMHELSGSFESLFSRRSSQIKERNIDVKTLNETDFKELILNHYTFLKRPVFMTDSEIFIGSEKKNIEALKKYLNE